MRCENVTARKHAISSPFLKLKKRINLQRLPRARTSYHAHSQKLARSLLLTNSFCGVRFSSWCEFIYFILFYTYKSKTKLMRWWSVIKTSPAYTLAQCDNLAMRQMATSTIQFINALVGALQRQQSNSMKMGITHTTSFEYLCDVIFSMY